MKPVRITVVGAGLIGKKHIAAINAVDGAELAAIVDPVLPENPYNVPLYRSIEEYLNQEKCDGAIIATPNHLHKSNAWEFLKADIPVLVEKPLTSDASSALSLVEFAESKQIPLLTGHHRRHNPLIVEAKRLIAEGVLGDIISVQTTCWFHKPQYYFEQEWRRKPGAGPIFINLIHDLDLIRHLCGEIDQIMAYESNKARGFEVEDTAVVLLRLTNGALGTISLSDTVSSPWSWELTSGENHAYEMTGQSCYLIGGTKASLSLPDLTLWKHKDEPDWWKPIAGEKVDVVDMDPLELQIKDFISVILDGKKPLVSGRDGYESLRAVEMIKQAATKK